MSGRVLQFAAKGYMAFFFIDKEFNIIAKMIFGEPCPKRRNVPDRESARKNCAVHIRHKIISV